MGEPEMENLKEKRVFKKYSVSSLIESSKTNFFYYLAIELNNPLVNILREYEINPTEEIKKKIQISLLSKEINDIGSILTKYKNEIGYLTNFSKYSLSLKYIDKKENKLVERKPLDVIVRTLKSKVIEDDKMYLEDLIKIKDKNMEYVEVNREILATIDNQKNIFLITDKLHLRTINAIAQNIFYDENNSKKLFVLALEDYI